MTGLFIWLCRQARAPFQVIIPPMRAKSIFILIVASMVLAACSSPATTPVVTQPLAPTFTQIETRAPLATWTSIPSPTMVATEPANAAATQAVRTRPPRLQTVTPTSQEAVGQPTEEGRFIDCSRTSVGFIPLMDMTADQDYLGQEGGLYGGGQNQPPSDHQARASQATAQIQPLDAGGNPSPDGRIGLISIGMSNAQQEFDRFMDVAAFEKSPLVTLVNGARPGNVASYWVKPDPNDDPWVFLENAIQRAGLTPQQVQVVWLKQANGGPRPGRDDFPVYAQKLRDDMATIVLRVKETYPNVRLVYLTSRIYAGYSRIALSPEPFAYEGAFSVRWLIQDQIAGGGESGVTYDNAPVLLWGAYLWADGTTSRSDGLTWLCDDFKRDGVHPGDSGRQKAAELMLNFFTTDPLTSQWFSRQGD